MSLVDLARLIRRTGRIAEPAPAARGGSEQPSVQGVDGSATTSADGPARDLPRALRGSVQVRHVDAGSCNGCEIELAAAFGPVYDAERYGARLVASPRHADAVLVTGVVTRNMAEPLRLTVEATPQPRVVLAVGDCARDCGMLRGAYGVVGAASDVVPVDLSVPGCPPAPADIVAALRQVTGR
ncbi:NADH-quinone oxidoreductase subunit B family protein [Cellulomonas sp. SG140]|uniref:NADH-quinone oxidoreductase subunit B family protein n=1 Tax=Cellulomonas sp. SG140 TaxID=2976536 RepID=UPI0021E74682|nr:oxidoreductase [Cellulomonas sp. SG140]